LNWREALTAISNGGYRTCHRVKRQQVPTASSNGGSRLLLIKFETTIYFRKIIKKIKKIQYGQLWAFPLAIHPLSLKKN
jgi:hypothetical protein